MPEPKYVCIKILDITNEFIDKYKLTGLDLDGWIYFKICQGCYGLPQAGILVNHLLCSCLKAEGFYEAASTPSLWCHKWRPFQFYLVVDNFGVEYVGLQVYLTGLWFLQLTTQLWDWILLSERMLEGAKKLAGFSMDITNPGSPFYQPLVEGWGVGCLKILTKPPRQSHGGAVLSQCRMRGLQNSAPAMAVACLAITTIKSIQLDFGSYNLLHNYGIGYYKLSEC